MYKYFLIIFVPMAICINDTTQKVFTNVQYCASDYSIGTNTTASIIIRVQEIESGRTMQGTYPNSTNRFVLSTTFFNSFNTYIIECFDSNLVPLKWTYDAIEYDSYKVKFLKMADEDCDNYNVTVNIG
jgi:hypothetical protein